MTRALPLRSVAVAVALASASAAHAVPAFARKYGMACSACHESWPKLNDQGIAFADNGYQFQNGGNDQRIRYDPASWPVAFWGQIGYQYTSLGGQQTNQGATTVNSGRLGFNSVRIMMAGTLAEDVSLFTIIQPFLTNSGLSPQYPSPGAVITNPGQIGLLEYFWLRFDNLEGSGWLNFKLGLAELDLPVDQDQTLTPLNPYAIYQYHPGGGANFMPFALGASQINLSLEGHSEDDSTRYSFSLLQTQDDPGENLAFAAPGVYLHVQKTFEVWPRRIPEITIGVMGMMGSYPTQALYSGGPAGSPASGSLVISSSGAGQPPKTCADPDDCGSADVAQQTATAGGVGVVPNTATALRPFYKQGLDLAVFFGNLTLPVALQVVYMVGEEHPTFINHATREAVYHGGFVEIDWTPQLQLTFVARYDFIRNLQQADRAAPTNFLDLDQGTLAVRYTLDLFQRAAVTLHAETSYKTLLGGGFNGSNFAGYMAFAGLDIVF